MLPRDAFEGDAEMEDFLAGRPLPKKPRVVRPEPEPPIVENQIRFDDISLGEIRDITAKIHHPPVRNKDGMMFVGHDVSVVIGEKTFLGWMTESDFLLLKKRLPPERTDLIQKISF